MSKFNMMDLLNNNSKESAMPTREKRNKFKTISINIYDLIPSTENFYSVDEEGINELKNSIEVFGLQQNLVVKKVENDKFEIIAGHRRYLALRKLVEEGKEQFQYAPCKVEIEEDSVKDKLILLITNSTTRELTDWEKVQQTEKLRELLIEYKKENKLTGRVREIIADILNISTTQIERMESISKNLTEEFKEELKEENLNISTAHEISRLPEEQQKEVYEEYKDKGNITIKDVKKKKENKNVTNSVTKSKEENVSNLDTKNEENKNLATIDLDTGEVVEQKIPQYLNKTILDIIKDYKLDEMATFLCNKCTSLGGGKGCAGLCDLAIECNQENYHEICIKWLNSKIE
ncbi:ParB/RepB/Spo0J family partition protein [Clostridium neonatale]|uniref:ParB/RepB/Spo0J family partition protein n=1 Tax=Clostridium neonatale TaxID=137838 RepID=UPI00291B6615|nr:ParB/RepB/Spo0J family partition protein [Clostridium neonatale]CAI3572023.1 ParB family transcriptional regulator, chromosome partitioning protein [Clostridium neonatale]CAI3604394.1 ParB family transcriptional regulator, chromosome partitioning protein [Clostridium neonatale]CAI3622004.1 ParB family transcriptional regulator, chromosome partitioning protein [Clostridium neonatale]CAI3668407.1 ParB family transcriptional regulator, chromosome partitioning protein [Clostridium neonatale]CAI